MKSQAWDVAMYLPSVFPKPEDVRKNHSVISFSREIRDGQHRLSRCARSTRPRK